MVFDDEKIKKIKELIDKKYNTFLISMFGKQDLPREVVEDLQRKGLRITNISSFASRIYRHNLENEFGIAPKPTINPLLNRFENFSLKQLNAAFVQLLERQKGDVSSRIEGIIREKNQAFKFDFLKLPEKNEITAALLERKSISKIKHELRSYSKDANRNWDRIVHTEVSNAIGIGSADRILKENYDKSTRKIYVYRIVVNDDHMCPHCRRFYLDSDGTPALYTLETLISNGSNYGKKAAAWQPGIGATHPNERCSPLVELKEGWKVMPGGAQTFIGLGAAWEAYVKAKLRS